ncbi:IPT/TIG domain-containing protein [Zhouia amylolytica]|uniref:IPT/TIG domain-containing protein n=1 Tax=Zhouia amylolytica AD3 TaxID=1286632 RepID=W2URY1_9FLAO|nr:IPT/TIG domain-containing protein [Zhouia amylolytica]ETN96231.1 hypothetical protein P278_07420 [Zhouia amylolytica AD3]
MMNKVLLFVFLYFLTYGCDGDDDLNQPYVAVVLPELVTSDKTITIEGEGLDNKPIIVYNGNTISDFTVSSERITFQLPEGSSSGVLELSLEQADFYFDTFIKVVDDRWGQLPSLPFTQFEMVNSLVGYATIDDGSLSKRRLYKTIDGGLNWTVILETEAASFFFDAYNSNQLWVYAGSNRFYRSMDGGLNWDETTVLDLRYLVKRLFFVSDQDGFLIAERGGNTYVFKSEDGGVQWKQSIEINAYDLDIVQTSTSSIQLIDYKTGTLYTTSDLGVEWFQGAIDLELGVGAKVGYGDIGYAFWNASINDKQSFYIKENPNDLWKMVSLPEFIANQKIIYIHLFDTDNIYILTKEGGNLYSTDGGVSWQLFFSESIPVTAVTALDTTIFKIGKGLLEKQEF